MDDPEYIYSGQHDEGYDSDRSTRAPSSSPAFGPTHCPPEPMQFSQQRRQKARPFREWLRVLTDTFIVRGTHTPMRWMLDLHTYGPRIHYSSTATGHMSWLGQDELLYKEVHFTMGDFRGYIHGYTLNLPAYRNIAIGISRRYLRVSSVFPQNLQDDGSAQAPADDDHEPEDHIADLQAAHSSHVAGMTYGREITEQAVTTAHRREMFRLSSTD
ncbi:uncharacterized protein N7458_003756 [Penicillium daleae]|uniref:Uncharacterized protein n=1 Tax=Penicillium daleae TaxID=63821 RepID=A0AAD6CB72_9EURO|nr:uncharacterized protein N7458_003756 [Penicillium daleae]KAJ5455492.1 hypothetical protein N7458_003756 [Penicillium daleae]